MMRKYKTNARRSIKKNKHKQKTSNCKPPDQANTKNVDDKPDALEPGRPHPKPLSLHHIALSVRENGHCHSIVAHCHSIVAHCHSIVAHCHSIVAPPRDLIVITLILLLLLSFSLSLSLYPLFLLKIIEKETLKTKHYDDEEIQNKRTQINQK